MKRSVAWVVVPLCLFAAAAAGGQQPIASLVPADAFLTVWYDGGHPGFRQTPLHKFFQEPEVVQTLKQFEPLRDRWLIKEMNEEAGGDLWSVLRVATGCEIVLALAQRPDVGEPDLLLAARVGAGDGPARRAAADLQKLILATGRADTTRELTIGALKIVSQEDKKGERRYLGFAGPFFVLASDEALLKNALSPLSKKLALPADAERAVLRVHYDHAALLRAFADDIKKNVGTEKILEALGLGAVRSAGFAFVPRGTRLVTTFQIDMPDAARRAGVTQWLAELPPVDRDLLKMVPRDSVMFAATSLDLATAWDQAWAIVEGIDPAAANDGAQALAAFEAQIGLKLRDGLLKHFGRGTVMVGGFGGLMLGGSSTVVQRVRNGDALEAAVKLLAGRLPALLEELPMAGFLGGARAEVRTFQYRGHACNYLWMAGMPALMMPGSVPCYARVDDIFIFSSHPLHLKEHLDFLVDKQPSILDHPEYRALQEAIPERASMISFGTWPDTIEAAYNTAAPLLNLLQGIPDLPAPLDVADLPSSRLLRRYAKGAVSYAVFDRGRLRVDVQGDGLSVLNPQVAPVAGVAILAGMLLPALARSRTEARRIRDRANLNQIAKGCAIYLNEHGDNRFYPSGLAELIDKGVLPDKTVFVSARDPDPPKLPNGVPCSFVSCFDKYPKRQFRDDFPPNMAMAWDRIAFPNSQGFRSVLFFDSHVEWVDAARFEQLLAELDKMVKQGTPLRRPKGAAGGEL